MNKSRQDAIEKAIDDEARDVIGGARTQISPHKDHRALMLALAAKAPIISGEGTTSPIYDDR